MEYLVYVLVVEAISPVLAAFGGYSHWSHERPFHCRLGVRWFRRVHSFGIPFLMGLLVGMVVASRASLIVWLPCFSECPKILAFGDREPSSC